MGNRHVYVVRKRKWGGRRCFAVSHGWEGNRFASMHLISFKRFYPLFLSDWQDWENKLYVLGELSWWIQHSLSDRRWQGQYWYILHELIQSITFQRDFTFYSDLIICVWLPGKHWQDTVSTVSCCMYVCNSCAFPHVSLAPVLHLKSHKESIYISSGALEGALQSLRKRWCYPDDVSM